MVFVTNCISGTFWDGDMCTQGALIQGAINLFFRSMLVSHNYMAHTVTAMIMWPNYTAPDKCQRRPTHPDVSCCKPPSSGVGLHVLVSLTTMPLYTGARPDVAMWVAPRNLLIGCQTANGSYILRIRKCIIAYRNSTQRVALARTCICGYRSGIGVV